MSAEGYTRAIAKFRWVVVAGALAFGVLATLGSLNLDDKLSTAGFWAPDDESTRAAEEFGAAIPEGPANLVFLVKPDGPVDSPEARAAGQRLTRAVAKESGLSTVDSYWDRQAAELRSPDGDAALVLIRVDGNEDAVKSTVLRLYDKYHEGFDGLAISFGGIPAAEREINARSAEDLSKFEALSTPVVVVILLLVFGSVVSSALPLVIGLSSVFGTLISLRVLSEFTDVSIYALNMATALSLGLAVDYGLFFVTRYREELDNGRAPVEAVAQTLRTAGRTILFSAFTVALSLAALLVFPLYYLKSFAYAGIAVVTFSALATMVLLPAVLVLLGPAVDKWDVKSVGARLWGRTARRAGGRLSRVDDRGGWHMLALGVMKRPILSGGAVVAVLAVMALPLLGASFGLTDETNLPRDSEASRVAHAVRADFSSVASDSLYVVAPDAALSDSQASTYAQDVSRVDGVIWVRSQAGTFADGRQVAPAGVESQRFDSGNASWMSVAVEGPSYGAKATDTVSAIRALPASAELLIGGPSAHLVDTRATLANSIPVAFAIVAVSTLVILFLFTGSVLVPVKAVVVNLLSLAATFGCVVWIFQHGHLQWLLGDFQVSGTVEVTTFVMVFAVAFGLSMDYEVFLLSRIKEEYERTGDNAAAIAAGLQRTGRIVTYGAVVFVTVMFSFALSSIGLLKLVGVGLGLAVLIDATLVRAILVPAVMRLAGSANWWAPAPLARIHSRWGLSDAKGIGSPRLDPASVAVRD